jgi:Xaa-Pro aminopeptidase
VIRRATTAFSSIGLSVGNTLAVVMLALVASVTSRPLRAQFPVSEFQQRRAALVAKLPEGVVVALGAREPAQDYLSFYQSPSFNYLTGFLEPDAALVMVKTKDSVSSTLFVQPRAPSREVWTGSRIGVEGARQRTGVNGRDVAQLARVLDSLAQSGLPFFVIGDFPGEQADASEGALTVDQQIIQGLRKQHPKLVVKIANGAVEQLRGTKSPGELAMVRKAVDVTVMAHREAMQALEPGMNEFELQALIEYTFRRNGADRPSFSTIVGSGPNATTLHYNADDRFITASDLIVMDIGASYKGYAADVTRTIPGNGVYSPAQRDVYQVVRDAQAAAERNAKLGMPARMMNDSANAAIAAGLTRLGLIESPNATYDCDFGGGIGKCPQYTLYYMHGLGHGIGLEVHDPDQYYYSQKIAPGSAFTIEPGIYVRGDVLEVLPNTPANRALVAKLRPAVQKYRNVGVRIEDDYVATDQGVEWISRAPREMDEIEALMRLPWTGPAKRNAALVESYRPIVP